MPVKTWYMIQNMLRLNFYETLGKAVSYSRCSNSKNTVTFSFLLWPWDIQKSLLWGSEASPSGERGSLVWVHKGLAMSFKLLCKLKVIFNWTGKQWGVMCDICLVFVWLVKVEVFCNKCIFNMFHLKKRLHVCNISYLNWNSLKCSIKINNFYSIFNILSKMVNNCAK